MHSTVILLLLTASSLFTHGMETFGMGYNGHCKCIHYERRLIPAKNLRSIEILPRGPHCVTTEVIATLVSGDRICLDHRIQWVRKVVRFIREKQKQKGNLM
ncbi:hypothetical protein AGOR_G00183370 [Albula goreensis]|uniref:C-X-C motif chemokine n=1 Tax=Albula goreensis TaxID=1534307 RepID=A0A8T3CXK1_9TELE|nr:hypothetical protein AGOR_G00183370 [Albula goreensis]